MASSKSRLSVCTVLFSPFFEKGTNLLALHYNSQLVSISGNEIYYQNDPGIKKIRFQGLAVGFFSQFQVCSLATKFIKIILASTQEVGIIAFAQRTLINADGEVSSESRGLN